MFCCNTSLARETSSDSTTVHDKVTELQVPETENVSKINNTQQERLKEHLESARGYFYEKGIEVSNSRIEFKTDRESGRTSIVVIDKETKQVIREIPPENILKVSQRLRHAMGLIFDDRV